jgi:hypothetical protein
MTEMNLTAQGREGAEQALGRAASAASHFRLNEAAGICKDLLLADPQLPGALGLLGGIRSQQGRFDEAIGLLERATARQADVANWHLNLSVLYRSKNLPDKALSASLQAVSHSPNTAPHRVELALAYVLRGERERAAETFQEAIAREPENAAGHMGLAEMLLANGELQPGWLEYEWRNKLDQARGCLPRMIAAPWNGMRMPNKTLLLVADQGFGDMIHFSRYIPMARERVGQLVLGWGPEVTALLGTNPAISQCFSNWGEVPPHDAYVLLSSLPLIFNTTLDSIPLSIPYITPRREHVAVWSNRLANALPSAGLRVGIAWSGRPTHPNNGHRSIRLETMAPILATQGVHFITLQKPFPQEDRAFAESVGNILDVSEELTSFGETSALIATLDLVIAVDTAVVHLAGAQGCETWVLLPSPSDWRWLLDREDSVWYPSLRLFRQTTPTDWSPVMQRAAAELRARVRADEPLRLIA